MITLTYSRRLPSLLPHGPTGAPVDYFGVEGFSSEGALPLRRA